MRITIAGAGIGGLTAALSLHAAGFDEVTVLESVPEIAPIGVGLNILPNAIREFDELGVADRLLEVAVATGSLSYYNRFGSLIWNEPRGIGAGYRWPQLSIHRGRLQRVLLDVVRERLGPDAVVADSRVVGFENRAAGGVDAHVLRGDGSTRTVTTDLLVGADGIHSAVRAAMHPCDGGPQWNGLLVWRGSAWAPPFLDGRTMVIAGDRGRRAVVYPMSVPSAPGEPVLMNWAVARRVEVGTVPDRADWNRPADPERFLPHFADLVFDWLDVPALVRSADRALEYPMVDRDPLPSWTAGRVTLLGDAAHAMNPMGSNGGTQSIVDGRVLARALVEHADPDDALLAYENERRPPMTALQEANRRMGPEVVIDLADERAPAGFADVCEVFPHGELARISASYATLGSFDPDTVNSRPSNAVQRWDTPA
ncbi:flavin-dependent oxidoreductase [Actinokineospora sp. NBRC 105648]|uniref:flavin-dependent oxidoreductase n=1 Tax=Actinokineospora sp. NBRC 105648 TaxID=3032206 RepID=UPI0024A05671|nr:flavin-dependent oxidoreductase [Actinokineospora sp. NBRC 105648]GLZ42519.1 flavin-dependent oxidoreductase [Actinokineospora sp. NBRC 105648]